MADKYCNPNTGEGFAPTQAGTSGDPFLGAYGIQKAIDNVAAGESIFIDGTNTVDMRKLVTLTGVGDDKTGSWVVGDSLRNDDGDGDNWVGVLCEITAATILVELSTGVYSDVDTADGIENTTQADTTTFSGKSLPGIVDDRAVGGSNTTVKIIGTNSSWTPGTLVVLDGGATPDIVSVWTLASNYRIYKYLKGYRTTGSVFGYSGSPIYHIYDHCVFEGSTGGVGINCNGTRKWFHHCVFKNNNSHGVTIPTGDNKFYFCRFSGNGADGCYSNYNTNLFVGCAFVNNTDDGLQLDSNAYIANIINCVFANNGGDGLYLATTLTTIRGCRFVKNTGYGIQLSSASEFVTEDYCAFMSNTAGNRSTIAEGPNSVVETDAGYGVVDESTGNYTTSDTAASRRQEIDIDWNE